MSEKTKSFFASIADFASVVIIPVFLWGWWSVQQSIALNRAQMNLDTKESFVSKVDFQSTTTALTMTDNKLWEKESSLSQALNDNVGQINLKLQHIEDVIEKPKSN